jgi:hypothetical protein
MIALGLSSFIEQLIQINLGFEQEPLNQYCIWFLFFFNYLRELLANTQNIESVH